MITASAVPPVLCRNTTKRAEEPLRVTIASAAMVTAVAEADRYCATACAGTSTSGGSHMCAAAEFTAPMSSAGKRWACFAR
jgi:hypothetical protein